MTILDSHAVAGEEGRATSNDLTRVPYSEARDQSAKDRRALEDAANKEAEVTAEVWQRNALAHDIGPQGSEGVRHRILSGLEHSPDKLLARVPARQRKRILHAYEEAKVEAKNSADYKPLASRHSILYSGR